MSRTLHWPPVPSGVLKKGADLAAPDEELETMLTKPPVKERAEALSSEMTDEQQAAIRVLANELHRLNQAVIGCVDAGLSVELQRTARHHSEDGFWGDLLVPIVVKQR